MTEREIAAIALRDLAQCKYLYDWCIDACIDNVCTQRQATVNKAAVKELVQNGLEAVGFTRNK